MTFRSRLTFLALNLITAAGCAGPMAGAPGGDAPTLVAYAGPSSDVTAADTRGLVVKVARFPDGVLHDPAQMMEVRLSIEGQISRQVQGVPEHRYRDLVRPSLTRALLEAGLTQADVDYILRGVDYHRSL